MVARSCSVEGCQRPHNAKGLCEMHYRRWRKRGYAGGLELEWNPNPPSTCSVEGCEEPHRCRGYCQVHYSAWSTYGDPLFVAVRKTGCFICHHPERTRIELDLLAGKRLRLIEVPGCNISTIEVQLSHHAIHCIGLPPRKKLCSVCLDDRAGEIDVALLKPGAKIAPAARDFDVPYHLLWYHSRHAGDPAHAAEYAAYQVARLVAIRKILAT